MQWREILQEGSYALLQSESDTQFVVAIGYDPDGLENQKWSSGHYYSYFSDKKKKVECLSNALAAFKELIK